MAIGLGSLMGTNSCPLASLPKDDACKPSISRAPPERSNLLRGAGRCGGKDPEAHGSSCYVFSSLFSWWAASCAAAGALQTYSDARAEGKDKSGYACKRSL